MSEITAYCWRSGIIEFGPYVPEGAITLAVGEEAVVRDAVDVIARHGYTPGVLLVSGVPEAEDSDAACLAVLTMREELAVTMTQIAA